MSLHGNGNLYGDVIHPRDEFKPARDIIPASIHSSSMALSQFKLFAALVLCQLCGIGE